LQPQACAAIIPRLSLPLWHKVSCHENDQREG
jgi:hypothetical protein